MNEQTPQEWLVRAAVAQRLAACFRYPRAGTAAALAGGLASASNACRPYPSVAAIVDRLAAVLEDADDARLQAEYSLLFIGGTSAPLHETAYGPPRLTTAAELADVQGFYRAFGFELSEATPEMPDHLGAELEFHAALLAKLAWAAVHELADGAEVTRSAAAAFLDEHLGRWTAALALRLRNAAPAAVYSRIAAEADAFVAAECERFAVTPVPFGATTPRTGDDVFACPHAAACADGAPPPRA
jgi:putative dimethyl sulfoxide reductase chaperone